MQSFEEPLQVLSFKCINKNQAKTLWGYFDSINYEGLKSCVKKDFINTWSLIRQNRGSYYIQTPDGDDSGQNVWFNEEIYNSNIGNNIWLRSLAIVNPRLHVLRQSNDGLIVFAGEVNRSFGIWAWKLDINDTTKPPYETSLIEFFAGAQANEDFIKYLLRSNNYANSKIPVILEKWASNPSSDLKIRAILPNKCKNVDVKVENVSLENPDENQIKDILHPIDTQKDQPECFTNILKNDNEQLNILIQSGSDNFLLYGGELDGRDISPMWEWYINNKQRENKWFTWFAMIMVVDCKQVADLDGGGTVLFCPGNLYCFRTDKADPYIPLDLLNKTKQIEFCTKTLRNYDKSIVKSFINDWTRTDEKFKIISYFNPDEFLRNLDSPGLIVDKLNLPISDVASSTLLLENKKEGNDSDFYLFKNNNREILNTKWSDILHKYRNDYLARLIIALGKDLKIINESNNILTLGILNPEPKIIAWKFDANMSNPPEEYSPLDSLYGNEEQKREIVNAITQNVLSSSNHPLQQIIESYFRNPTPLIIRQVFPKNFSFGLQKYSPLNIFGDNQFSSVLPIALKKALENKSKLDFLIQKGGSFMLLEGKNKIDITMGNLLKTYKNPWIAWITLADSKLEIITKRESTNTVDMCLTSGSDNGGHFWGLSFEGLNKPSEFKLIDSGDEFTLTGSNVSNYISSLSTKVTASEEDFFLDHLTSFKQIKLADIISYSDSSPSSERVLLWYDTTKLANLQLNRTGYTIPIKINLIDNNLRDSSWIYVADSYKEDWFSDRIKQDVVKSNADNLKLWIGNKRLGIERGNEVGVFLPPSKRNFGFINIKSIKRQVNGLAYKPMERSRNSKQSLTKKVFFESWVAEEWDKNIWRANPLGYFDTVK